MTRFRNFLRRFLGVEQFERTTISELNTYRRDVDNWTREMPNRREVSAMTRRHDSLRREVENLGVFVQRMLEGMGGALVRQETTAREDSQRELRKAERRIADLEQELDDIVETGG